MRVSKRPFDNSECNAYVGEFPSFSLKFLGVLGVSVVQFALFSRFSWRAWRLGGSNRIFKWLLKHAHIAP